MQKLYTLVCCLFMVTVSAAANTPLNKGIVVSESKIASDIGASILRQGGNAIDAAVAVGYALAVVDPCCGNIGGGGFMTIHLASGKNIFINFRETAPLRATKTMFANRDQSSTAGYLAVGVPGTVLGLESARRLYGTLPRKTLIEPAIRLAKNGFIITPYEAKRYATYRDAFAAVPSVAKIFLHQGKPYQVGERLIQSDLANSLSLIAKNGTLAFYHGQIANDIVHASNQHGGLLTLNDFSRYRIQIKTPITCHYKGYTIISAPPPSSGGVTLCESLNILENFPLRPETRGSFYDVRVIANAMGKSFADRNSKLGDPDYVNNPISQLLAKDYAKKLAAQIEAETHHTTTVKAQPLKELTDTTHYSVIDRHGNAVALTYTLNGFFGAGVIADHTGFFLNNEMDDFATEVGKANKFGLVQQDANAIAPGKRPLSSMTPTIIMKDKTLFMVIGSPGGPRIITSVLLTILNVINYQLSLQQAMDAPRFHYQGLPDVINIEPDALSNNTIQLLTNYGFKVTPQTTWSAIAAIMQDPKTNTYVGAIDKRRPDGGVAVE